uniref:Uncharacterized protein n=1 Tax=Arundo donax TaxID=35708 RepID=A0A0A9FZ99_ARUDO
MLTAPSAVASRSGRRSIMSRDVASVNRKMAIPPPLASSSGRRPIRSRSSVEIGMKNVLHAPTAMEAPSELVFDLMPARSNTRGLYITTQSTPVACWMNMSPRPAVSMRRTGRDGFMSSSFHTPSLCEPLFARTMATTSSASDAPSGMPTTFLMSSSRSSASSGESEVFCRTRRASSMRPRKTSHRGDSGMARTATPRNTGGTAPTRNIARQLRWTGRRAKAKLET